MKKHEYIGTSSDDKFCIRGIDIFKYKWNTIGDVAVVIDPTSKKPRNFSAYKITVGGKDITFLAGKLSNGSWGFFNYD
ncbi:hypothetical protein AGMMS50284_0630 [Clostridia bacterium]|nr:hypothetical protein AGMMS50284_0630 [Clostridia bacterium]